MRKILIVGFLLISGTGSPRTQGKPGHESDLKKSLQQLEVAADHLEASTGRLNQALKTNPK